ncbi:MAG: 3-dehydroquinate synthase, partial [Planctomycetes bacterium]|nr:3-dehydroquinate synthase [Planctomycetota bacterium]
MPVPACTIRVALGPRSYEIRVTTGGLAEAGQFARGLTPGRRAIIVTDRHVANPHAASVQCALEPAGFQADQAVLEPGEKTKSLASAAELYDVLAESAADRQTLVVAVGGGVIGDLAGFVAATYARGIPYLQVPTTLLAQVDSAVGGKVGVNHPKGKNLIGAFYQPVGVLIDTDVLRTLPDREYRCGLAEVIKYGVVLDADFFAYLESHVEEIRGRDPEVLRFVIARCCRLKADIVEQDEREEIVGGQGSGVRGRKQPGMAFGASAAVVGDQATPEVCSKEPVGRWVLNFGHTFAHALETLAGYELLHGEAVAVG